MFLVAIWAKAIKPKATIQVMTIELVNWSGPISKTGAAVGLWDEAGRLGATLDAVRGWLRTGDLDPGALASSSTGLEVGVVTAPAAVVVPILDLAYLGKPGGYVWSTRRDVTVSVRLPAWMAGSPVTVGEVRAGETTSLDSTTRRSGDVLTISVPELQVGTILVVQPRPGP